MTPVTPHCPSFGTCGGCSTQHISHETQLENKKQFVLQQLQKNSIRAPVITMHSGEHYSYRSRMDFAFFKGGVGLRQRRQYNSLVDIGQCAISNEKLNTLLGEVRQWFAQHRQQLEPFDHAAKKGTLRYAVIRSPLFSDDATVSFVINGDSPSQQRHMELIRAFATATTAKNVVVAKVPATTDESISRECFAVKGSVFVAERILGKTLQYHSQSFFQNNPAMTERMVAYVKQLLSSHATPRTALLDLYGGVGTFGICLADLFSECILVESAPESIACANHNIKANSITNTTAVCADAAAIGNQPLRSKLSGKPLVVIADPPRSGMHPKAVQRLLDLQPQTIIYISCNPAQLAKELRSFTKRYDMTSLAIFDLFPQTNHMEVVAELRLRNNSA